MQIRTRDFKVDAMKAIANFQGDIRPMIQPDKYENRILRSWYGTYIELCQVNAISLAI